jgi:NRAMP (natural resistance-associated macrophage protein)-like metal ion transporter
MNRFSKKLKRILAKAGPGIITGAADDDPSGILTYLQSGVVIGVRILWVALFTLPLMYGVQEMCARIGYVTDRGLTAIIKSRYSKKILYFIATISFIVITVNIGADLLAGAAVLQEFVPVGLAFWLVFCAVLILFSVILLSYRKFSRVMMWLTLSLLCYVVTVFFMRLDWKAALLSTITPSFSFSKENIMLLAAVLGTTISPYLFFWQANEEAESRGESQKERGLKRFLVTKNELKILREDVFSGMFYSNIVMWFMIAGASVLSLQGVSHINTFHEAAEVLRPFLGNAAYIIFSIGILGTGFLAIPVLAGSVGYIMAEVFGWSEGIDKKFHEAPGFYLSIALATAGGLIINLFHVDPVQLLIYTAVLYTLITPPILYFILKIGNDKEVMKGRVNSRMSNFLGGCALVVMTGTAVAYVVSYFI